MTMVGEMVAKAMVGSHIPIIRTLVGLITRGPGDKAVEMGAIARRSAPNSRALVPYYRNGRSGRH